MADNTNEAQKWAEALPEKCPPSDAISPQNEIFYRLVDANPPIERDFYSQRLLAPTKGFSADECIVRATSLFHSLDACKTAKALPKLRNKNIVRLELPPESGVVKNTRSMHHYSWWRTLNFNPIPFCSFVE